MLSSFPAVYKALLEKDASDVNSPIPLKTFEVILLSRKTNGSKMIIYMLPIR